MSEGLLQRFLVDASVAVKWFDVDERYLAQARSLLDAHLEGRTQLLLSQLVPFEVGNALIRGTEQTFEWPTGSLWSSGFVWVTLDPTTAEAARDLAFEHGLSYYDASHLALAIKESAHLVSDDQVLINAAVAEGVGIPLEEIPVD